MSITILIVTFCGNCDSSDRIHTQSDSSIRIDIESSDPNCIGSCKNSDTNDNDNTKRKRCIFIKNYNQQRISVVKAPVMMMTSASDDHLYVNRRVNNNTSIIIVIANDSDNHT